MSEGLKPCPFCGFDTLTREGELVICLNCGATHGDLHWQTRPIEDELRARAERAEADNRRMAIQNEAMDIILHRIVSWCDAYPVDVFPEPDFVKARELLRVGGISLDSVSASNMRHVINGFRDLAQGALDALKGGEG